ncbi:hypothetical protein EK21DRAFT_113332 [Setomelanomma holmii]|uniref:Transposase n=1 Tax=Setomelanomma holmii TaxID=210430 RepID=A0A9P4LL79_9PLEO|nr:hypothetical protein EK21DRAFT_113332 [Setomelanomma holmii]
MPKEPKRRYQCRFNTPPPVVASDDAAQLATPQRSAVFAVLYFCQKKRIHCSLKDIHEVFNISTSTSSRVLRSGRPRRLQNSDQPETRGRPREFSAQDAEAIASLLDELPFEDKDLPWQDLSVEAGVLKDITREAANTMDVYSERTIQRHVTAVTGVKSHPAAVKEKHTETQQNAWVAWCAVQLQLRPNGADWRCVLWCDELHYMTGPKYQKNVKRRVGERYKSTNIQYEKDHKPDPEKQHHFHIFTVVGYNFSWCMPYNAGTSNGKMTSECYINTILPALKAYLLHVGGDWILWQDRDSAHISRATLKWMDQNSLPYINSSPKSPDLSIMETWAGPLKRNSAKKRCWTEKQGVKRFYEVWKKLDCNKINRTIDSYPKRLQDCKDKYYGLATKY